MREPRNRRDLGRVDGVASDIRGDRDVCRQESNQAAVVEFGGNDDVRVDGRWDVVEDTKGLLVRDV